MRNILSRFKRPYIAGMAEQLMLLNSTGDGSTLSLDFTTGVLDPRITFTRDGGGTYVANDGLIYGVDFATSSSLAIGTGSKSVTLTATAGVDRRYLVGQTVWISNGANNMRGAVTAYDASTQVVTINATATSGSGSFTSWTVGNASARFDYDPTTRQPRGLLVEGSAQNLAFYSDNINPNSAPTSTYWQVIGTGASVTPQSQTDPAGTTLASRCVLGTSTVGRVFQGISTVNGTTYTISFWAKSVSGNTALHIWHFNSATSNYTAINVTTSWARYSVTVLGRSGGGFVECGIANLTANAATVDMWGLQLETGSGASSYIPTGSSTATRNADSAVMTGTNFSSWFAGATEGVLYVEAERPRKIVGGSADHAYVSTRYASGQGLWVFATATNQYPAVYIFPSGGGQFAGGIATQVPLVTKQAVRWFNQTSITNIANGVLGGSNTSGTGTMVPTMLSIGAHSTTGTEATLDWSYAAIRRVKFWPTALPNATIQALTT